MTSNQNQNTDPDPNPKSREQPGEELNQDWRPADDGAPKGKRQPDPSRESGGSSGEERASQDGEGAATANAAGTAEPSRH